MAMVRRLLTRVVVIAAVAFCARPVSAQNVMRLRIDTVTAKPGATVDVRVLYTFTSTHAHNIHDFNTRFLFDTSKSHLVAYILDGAARIPFFADTTGSHAGLLALGTQEIDLTDSVLYTIRMTLDSNLDTINGDTAWVRWDPEWTLSATQTFGAGDEGVDAVDHEDGWIRTPPSPPMSVVDRTSANEPLRMYPNPAREEVTIDAPGYGEGVELQVYDAVGRLRIAGPFVLGAWRIPSGFESGAYEMVLKGASAKAGARYIGTLIVTPR